ncbi:MAG: hypothetical protein C0403_02890 [Desulfobacterium sp.]|nr:hypothetical protein [Desulfobacterium sp.]
MTIIGNLSDTDLGFNFFLSNTHQLVSRDSKVWNQELPLNRKSRKTGTGLSVSYGEYFTAAKIFLEENNHKVLRDAISQQSRKNISLDQSTARNIYLEKHGEFYHPSRVELVFPEEKIQFVLNIAASETGRNIIDQEYSILRRLHRESQNPYTPAVYGKGFVKTDHGILSMFIGQWFEGFHEFHLSESSREKRKLVVWDMVRGNQYLSDRQAKELYHKAALILTSYYHPITFEHIFPWHHAAGDFVVCLRDTKVDLRLITIRGYSSLDEGNVDPNLQSIMENMLVFFLILSIRMRIDRLDGVKEIIWAEDFSVLETLNGFFEGLEEMSLERTRGIPLAECFEYYIFSMEDKDLVKVTEGIVDHYHIKAEERKIIQKNLKEHVAGIKQGLIKRNL